MLASTPTPQTIGFFNGNVVQDYSHEKAVADGVNVGYDIYRIATQITAGGAKLEKQPGHFVPHRDRRTGKKRLAELADDLTYTANQLDRDVVAKDQIRLVIRTFKERLFTDIFPGRTEVPKTLVFAKTDPAKGNRGISCFIVERAFEGMSSHPIHGKLGVRAGNTGSVVLQDVRVPAANRLGEEGEGFKIAMSALDNGRYTVAAGATGLIQASLEASVKYAMERQTFGVPIAEHQGVAFPLAEAAMQVHAAHLMGLNAAALLDRGHRAVKELSMTKAYSVEVCLRAVDRAMQTHGAMGFTNEVGLVHAYNILRVINVADGTNEILRRTIFQQLAKGDLEL